MTQALLEASGLVKVYGGGGRLLFSGGPVKRAVDDVSFHLLPNETYGLAGESGSGKSTLARLVTALVPATGGSVRFDDKELFAQRDQEMFALRREMQIVAQDPSRALNPRHTVFRSVALPFRVHLSLDRRELRERVSELLADVGLGPAERFLDRYPHQLSGGQRQRVAIARAIALRPKLLVADEAVSALDVSVRAQILALMKRLQREHGLTYLFITHDLAVLRSIADRVGIMYLGRLVEEAPREALYGEPLHPYTRLLLDATPTADRQGARRESPRRDFPLRCSEAAEPCSAEQPRLVDIGAGRRVACHLHPSLSEPAGTG